MIEIDGSAGGGQLLRSAVAMAAVTGRSVRVADVRGDRPDPGVKHQHRAAVAAVAACCDADVEGCELGSETVTFEPGPVTGGEVAVEIPTAGSVTLVFDAVLPLAAALDEPLRVTATGGTDVRWSPASPFYRRVKLPLLAEHGVVARADLTSHGFYPEGGGEATLSLAPASPSRLDLVDRGDPLGVHVVSVCTHDLAESDVARRQATAAVERLREADCEILSEAVRRVDAPSPGSVALVRTDFERSLAGFSALGEPGRRAEDVGEAAAGDALSFLDGPGAVDRHLADQLLPFLAVAGGAVRIPAVTDHVESHLSLLRAFGFEVESEERAGGAVVRSPGQ
ncbi:RNA 3'-terminal phosphate cyclase [Halomicrobium salinisoli]|uniref:RNA 3'-terminal phosphate cyclase n=1 Tax=Halomicrobium salinisoli TaxID=2878391 RepID=UPI001CF0A82A|nr:RNA 3'-terminal phosphate cyclase [Halomicrobium salinisoli]